MHSRHLMPSSGREHTIFLEIRTYLVQNTVGCMVFCAQVLAHALSPVLVDPPLLQGKVWGEDAPLLVTQV